MVQITNIISARIDQKNLLYMKSGSYADIGKEGRWT